MCVKTSSLTSTSSNKTIKWALISCDNNNVLYAAVPLASLIGAISVTAIFIQALIISASIVLPIKNCAAFGLSYV